MVAETKECTSCGEQIPMSATLCRECKSYQDWRRWVPFSQTVLALLTALISVFVVGATALVPMFAGHGSELSASFQTAETTEGRIFFVVTNAGDRPGSVAEPGLATVVPVLPNAEPGEQKYEFVSIPLRLAQDWNGFVGPGESRQVAISGGDEASIVALVETMEPKSKYQNPTCRADFWLVEFNTNRHRVSKSEKCLYLIEALYPGLFEAHPHLLQKF